MIIIKKGTKKAEKMLASARNVDGYDLSDVYGRCSNAKYNAMKYCTDLFLKEAGSKNFHICSHNTFSFSVAWESDAGVRMETANNSYLIEV